MSFRPQACTDAGTRTRSVATATQRIFSLGNSSRCVSGRETDGILPALSILNHYEAVPSREKSRSNSRNVYGFFCCCFCNCFSASARALRNSSTAGTSGDRSPFFCNIAPQRRSIERAFHCSVVNRKRVFPFTNLHLRMRLVDAGSFCVPSGGCPFCPPMRIPSSFGCKITGLLFGEVPPIVG